LLVEVVLLAKPELPVMAVAPATKAVAMPEAEWPKIAAAPVAKALMTDFVPFLFALVLPPLTELLELVMSPFSPPVPLCFPWSLTELELLAVEGLLETEAATEAEAVFFVVLPSTWELALLAAALLLELWPTVALLLEVAEDKAAPGATAPTTDAFTLSAALASILSAASSSSARIVASVEFSNVSMMWFCIPAVAACGGAHARRALTSARSESAG